MSRALGAAFLSHQVEQLEKTVSDVGPGAGNWRDRRTPNNRGHNHPDGKRSRMQPAQPRRRDGDNLEMGDEPDRKGPGRDVKEPKDADVVVIDASVLVHALTQVRKWCRDGREEIIIVPLEGTPHCSISLLTPHYLGLCWLTLLPIQRSTHWIF